MKLITGGAFQGKRIYAQKAYQIPEREVVDAAFASAEEIAAAGLVDHFQEYVRRYQKNGECTLPDLRKDAVVICDEVGCGVIPLSREEREFREAAGRLSCTLAEQAETVEWVRCGIARRIK